MLSLATHWNHIPISVLHTSGVCFFLPLFGDPPVEGVRNDVGPIHPSFSSNFRPEILLFLFFPKVLREAYVRQRDISTVVGEMMKHQNGRFSDLTRYEKRPKNPVHSSQVLGNITTCQRIGR